MRLDYDDTNPPSSNTTSLGFTLTKSTATLNNVNGGQIGTPVTYTVEVRNKAVNASMGLVVIVFRVPSCYQMNYERFEGLKASGVIDMYEFKNGNSEVWMYISSLNPSEIVRFDIDLT